eukprot:GGOE01026506.1.p2 GENE.GGOE01026506.1~~GGOE01026506.1.p2  ORF type:complete len:137 (-),score=1.07 GGOE01026506.1:28-438(-)
MGRKVAVKGAVARLGPLRKKIGGQTCVTTGKGGKCDLMYHDEVGGGPTMDGRRRKLEQGRKGQVRCNAAQEAVIVARGLVDRQRSGESAEAVQTGNGLARCSGIAGWCIRATGGTPLPTGAMCRHRPVGASWAAKH